MFSAQRLQNIIGPTVTAMGYELWGCEVISQGRMHLVRVYIDHTNGVKLDDCSAVSQQISGVLDVADLFTSPYQLEVSSPGLDRPLFTLDHYHRFIGHKVRVTLSHSHDGRRQYSGVIIAVDDQTVMLRVNEEQIPVAFRDIHKGRLIPEY